MNTAITQETIDNLLQSRYAQPGASSYPSSNPVINALLQHRSVRAYDPRPLPEDTLPLLVAAAQSASTSSNLQVWSLVAVQNPEKKAKLAALAGNQKHILDCPLFLVWLADLSRLRSRGELHGVPHESLDYLEMFLVASVDATLAAQNAAVAAESMGMGIVYIGGIRNQPEQVAEVLELPPNVFAVFGMCVGYPDPQRPASIKPRLQQEAVLHMESYQPEVVHPSVESYNEVMSTFYTQQGMKTQGAWDLHSLNRVKDKDAMKGRDRLTEALNNLGFDLR